jgi:hypothetical protein
MGRLKTGEQYTESDYKTESRHTFDIDFIGAMVPTWNHTMWISLKVCLQQNITDDNWVVDSDGNKFGAQEWTTAQWLVFKEYFRRQAQLWDSRFVLEPPRYHRSLRYKSAAERRMYFPKIECRFVLTVLDSPSDAHWTVKVARMSDSYVPRIHGGGPFHSGTARMSSFDGFPKIFDVPDNLGNVHLYIHPTITHEIGHLLGQPHIGVLKRTGHCMLARRFKGREDELHLPEDSEFRGGDASPACYGSGENRDIGGNIMGYGINFDVVNAGPWLEAAVGLTETRKADWKVYLASHLSPSYLSLDLPPSSNEWNLVQDWLPL